MNLISISLHVCAVSNAALTPINLPCLCSVGASVETAVSFCYKTSVNIIAVAKSGVKGLLRDT